MDIYEWAKEHNADYMDCNYNIYKVQKYNNMLKSGFTPKGIEVYTYEGEFLGFALRKN